MGQHHKFRRAMMLGPVAALVVAAVAATPLVVARPDARTRATTSAESLHTLSTAKSNATERAFARRSAAAAEVSRSAQRAALVRRQVREQIWKQELRRQQAKAAALLQQQVREQTWKQELRRQQARAAALLQQQVREQTWKQELRRQQAKAAALLLHQRQVQALAARRAAADRASRQAAQRAQARRLAVKRTFNAARLGSPKEYAQSLIGSGSQYGCLVLLWTRESSWNYQASNASSGAYGIPQSLPGSKMASAGADWRTNPATQIRWGLGYIRARYGTPCGAWSHSQAVGWY